MGCRSDYLEPTEREKALQETAQLYLYFFSSKFNDEELYQKVYYAANYDYCKTDFVPDLCKAISSLTEKERDHMLYSDAKDTWRRLLAIWWERHAEADRIRKEKEQTEKKLIQEKLIQDKKNALKKLTPYERHILGLIEE